MKTFVSCHDKYKEVSKVGWVLLSPFCGVNQRAVLSGIILRLRVSASSFEHA